MKTKTYLFFILIVGALLRVWAIDFGLPEKYRPDEWALVNPALRFIQGDLDPRWFVWPNLNMYVLALVYKVVGLFKVDLLSFLTSSDEYWAYLIARYTAAAFSILGILAAYSLTKQLYDRRTAIISTTLLTFNFLDIREAHFSRIDPLTSLLLILAATQTVRVIREKTLKAYLTAGLLTGLAISAKYSAAPFVLSLIIAHFIARPAPHRYLLESLACVPLGFLIGSPFALITPELFLSHVFSLQIWINEGVTNLQAHAGPLWFSAALRYSSGSLFIVCVLCGLIAASYALIRRNRARISELPVIIFIGAYSLCLMQSNFVFIRYVHLLMPFLCIYAAHAICLLRRHLVLGCIIAVLVSLGPLTRSIQSNIVLGQTDTRTLALTWIKENLPKDSQLAVIPPLYGKPSLPQNRSYVRISKDGKELKTAKWALIDEHPLTNFSRSTTHEMQQFLEKNAEVVFKIDPFKSDDWSNVIFDPADAFYLPFSGFSQITRPGPRITIYKINSSPAS